MAKSTAKTTAKPSLGATQYTVGWMFWFVCFFVLAAPSWYLARGAVYESERDGLAPYIAAFALAALGAGVLSYLVNAIFLMRAGRARKQARQRKKEADYDGRLGTRGLCRGASEQP